MGKYYLVTTYYSKAYLVFYKEGLQLLLLGTESIRLFKALKVRFLRMMVKVNSVQEACAKCFAILISKFEIMQIT